jgi:Co/Zn/Cd efflux system component
MWKRILESGKAIALLPSLSLFVGAVFLGFYGIYILIETLYKAFTDETTRDSTILATSSYRLWTFTSFL